MEAYQQENIMKIHLTEAQAAELFGSNEFKQNLMSRFLTAGAVFKEQSKDWPLETKLQGAFQLLRDEINKLEIELLEML